MHSHHTIIIFIHDVANHGDRNRYDISWIRQDTYPGLKTRTPRQQIKTDVVNLSTMAADIRVLERSIRCTTGTTISTYSRVVSLQFTTIYLY